MNSVNLIGNIATEQYRINEYKDKNGNTQYVVNGSIAVNEPQGNGKNDIVTFIDFTAFGGNANVFKNLTVKGSQVAIEGKWRKDKYESKGQKRVKDYVLVRNVKLLDTKEQTQEKRKLLNDNTSNQFNDNDIPPIQDDDMPF